MYQELIEKKYKLAVVGLGYVGLPIALEFAKKFSVIGFDIHSGRIETMKKGIDPSNELDAEDFLNKDIFFTADWRDIIEAKFFIIAVPTPVDVHKNPDLRPLFSATTTVSRACLIPPKFLIIDFWKKAQVSGTRMILK